MFHQKKHTQPKQEEKETFDYDVMLPAKISGFFLRTALGQK